MNQSATDMRAAPTEPASVLAIMVNSIIDLRTQRLTRFDSNLCVRKQARHEARQHELWLNFTVLKVHCRHGRWFRNYQKSSEILSWETILHWSLPNHPFLLLLTRILYITIIISRPIKLSIHPSQFMINVSSIHSNLVVPLFFTRCFANDASLKATAGSCRFEISDSVFRNNRSPEVLSPSIVDSTWLMMVISRLYQLHRNIYRSPSL